RAGGDELVPGVLRDGALTALARRHDLHELPARDGGEALHLQHGLEDEVRLLGRDAGGGEDGNRTLDGPVGEEGAARDLAREAPHERQVHVLEVERGRGVGRRAGGSDEAAQQQRGDEASHRRPYPRVRPVPPRTMSTATRGSLRSRSRKASRDAGSLTGVPLTRCTTAPSWMAGRRR